MRSWRHAWRERHATAFSKLGAWSSDVSNGVLSARPFLERQFQHGCPQSENRASEQKWHEQGGTGEWWGRFSLSKLLSCDEMYRFLRMLVKQCETSKQDWLVVWNIFYFPIYGNTNPNWRTHIFQRRVGIPPTRGYLTYETMWDWIKLTKLGICLL
jgi:hypothetical protein